MDFEELLRKLICELMKQYGLDCEGLGTPEETAATILAVFNAQGPPPTPTDLPAYLNLLDQIDATILRPDNPLPAQTNDQLKVMVQALRATAGGNNP